MNSQIGGLEEIYKEHFGDHKGTFVEVGAFDGETNSNTCDLADSGWSGVYIEPIVEYALLCSSRHAKNNVEVINRAVGSKRERKTISMRGQLTTFSVEQQVAIDVGVVFPKDWGFKAEEKAVEVQVDTLDNILNSICVSSRSAINLNKVDLLVIDTELYEDKVLEGFSIEQWNPTMVIVELHENSQEWQSIPRQKEITERVNGYFQWHKYKKIYVDDINTIFVQQ